MKKLVCALAVCAMTLAVVAADKKSSLPSKPLDQMTPEEREARRAEVMERRLRHFGENMVKPGSLKGKIAIVNGQKTVDKAELTKVVDAVCKFNKYDFVLTDDSGDAATPMNAGAKMKELGVDVAVFVIECDKCENMMLVAPEAGWAIVNATAVCKGAANDTFKAARMRKMVLRAYYAAGGAMCSKYPGSLMCAISSPSDLDKLGELAPVDVIARTKDALEHRGVTPEIKSFYRRACEEGWAPQPTNDIQRAIWNEVNAAPTNPIKIKPGDKPTK